MSDLPDPPEVLLVPVIRCLPDGRLQCAVSNANRWDPMCSPREHVTPDMSPK
jgi:hypothetical protein